MSALADARLAPPRTLSPDKPAAKLGELDSVRGIAAVVVFNLHFLGFVRGDVLAWLSGTPLYGLANGGAAVMLFFVLSGFVLTLAPLRAGRGWRLAGPALRRYPRLAGPVVVAALLSIVLARTGGFPAIGRLAGTGKRFPQSLFWGSQMHNDAPWPVLREATYGTFFQGVSIHNAVLWTMQWELLGSAVAFGLAFILLLPLPRALRLAGACGLAGVAVWHSIWLVGFPLGVACAVGHLRHGHRLRLSPRLAILLFCAAAFLMSWDIEHDAGAWRWADRIAQTHRYYLWACAECGAGALMLAIAIYCAPARRLMGTRLFRTLGRLSFPLYLTHFFTLLSIGAWACLMLFPNGVRLVWLPAFYLAMLAMACGVAYPVAVFDRLWIRLLSRLSPR